ncbi:hypothetical protein K438DRAFT_1966516 [Mycena galopus ATCC 62051]|nr:hypothetical protein K438DRAFT_1966516 [Mycena galopus ATCC 62051]
MKVILNEGADLFHISFPRESWGIKALVYTLFVFDLLQTAFSSHLSFAVLVTSWGNPAVFAKLPWTSFSLPVGAGIVSGIVQMFFAWRIYVLKGSNPYIRIVIALIVMTAFMQTLSAIANGLRFAFAPQITSQLQLAIGVKVKCNLYPKERLLMKFIQDLAHRKFRLRHPNCGDDDWHSLASPSADPWKTTDSIITKLIYHTVETGAVTAIAAGIELVLFLVYPTTFLDDIPAFLLGKLYSNGVLETLNSRPKVASPVSEEFAVSMSTTADGVQFRLRSNNQTINDDFEMDMARKVQVNTVTHVHLDVPKMCG